MTFPFSKAFSLSALAAVSTLGVAIAQPAEALTVTRTNNPDLTSLAGYIPKEIKFNTPGTTQLPQTFFSGTDDQVIITNTGSGNSSISGGTLNLSSSNASPRPAVTFTFSKLLPYFGVRFVNNNFGDTDANDTVITFFNGADSVGSFTRQFLTNLSFTGNGTGDYYNFNQNVVSQRFDSVVIAGKNVVLDDVAYRVPTPALLPGLVGMGVAALRKRKAEEEQEA